MTYNAKANFFYLMLITCIHSARLPSVKRIRRCVLVVRGYRVLDSLST